MGGRTRLSTSTTSGQNGYLRDNLNATVLAQTLDLICHFLIEVALVDANQGGNGEVGSHLEYSLQVMETGKGRLGDHQGQVRRR